jgi:hypothetical protein
MPNIYRYIKGNELPAVFGSKGRKSKSNVVYFKSNKSETVRELLNQMRTERPKDSKIILNSMLRDLKEDE